jgi:20S proteasome subunit beta 7
MLAVFCNGPEWASHVLFRSTQRSQTNRAERFVELLVVSSPPPPRSSLVHYYLTIHLLRFFFFRYIMTVLSSSSSSVVVAAAGPKKVTTRPMVTGTSVLGIVYDGGVLLAADTLLSYGSMAKHQGVSRMFHVPDSDTVVAASGEFSDFQEIKSILAAKSLEELHTANILLDDMYADHSPSLTASSIWNYLRHIMYAKRNKYNPYWNEILVAGTDEAGQAFLGSVDKLGLTLKENVLATGFGAYLALPILRGKWRPDLNEGEARGILEDCLKVLFYRDCQASSLVQLAKSANHQALISDPYPLETEWSDPAFIEAAPAAMDGDGGW